MPLFRELERPADAGDIRSLTFDAAEFRRRHEALRAAMRGRGPGRAGVHLCAQRLLRQWLRDAGVVRARVPDCRGRARADVAGGRVRGVQRAGVELGGGRGDLSVCVGGSLPTRWSTCCAIAAGPRQGLGGSTISTVGRTAYESYQHAAEVRGRLRGATSIGLVDGVRARKSAAEIAADAVRRGRSRRTGSTPAAAELRPNAPDTAVAAAIYQALVGARQRAHVDPAHRDGRPQLRHSAHHLRDAHDSRPATR